MLALIRQNSSTVSQTITYKLRTQKLSEEELEYIIKNNKLTNYSQFLMCSMQTLSEGFIRKYKHLFKWGDICTYQKLSEDFIREFICEFDHEDLWCIYAYQSPSNSLYKELKNIELSSKLKSSKLKYRE